MEQFPRGILRSSSMIESHSSMKRRIVRSMGLLCLAVLGATAITPPPEKREYSPIAFTHVQAYPNSDEMDFLEEEYDTFKTQNDHVVPNTPEELALLQSLLETPVPEETLVPEVKQSDWLALLCTYPSPDLPVLYDPQSVHDSFYGTEYPNIGLNEYAHLVTMGKYEISSVDIGELQTLPYPESHYYPTITNPDGTSGIAFDITKVSNDCLVAHGITDVPPEQHLAFYLPRFREASGYGGFTVFQNPLTGQEDMRSAYWLANNDPGTRAHEFVHMQHPVAPFGLDHELSETYVNGIPQITEDGRTINVNKGTGLPYKVEWSPTGRGSQMGVTASSLFYRGYLPAEVIETITITDEPKEYEFELEPVYPGIIDDTGEQVKKYAIRIKLPLNEAGETMMPNVFRKTNPEAHELHPDEYLWIEYRDLETTIENGTINLDALGNGLQSGFIVYVEQYNYPNHPIIEPKIWFPKQFQALPDGSFQILRDYARKPMNPLLPPFQPWTRNMLPSKAITICPQITGDHRHGIRIGINQDCQRATPEKVYLPRVHS